MAAIFSYKKTGFIKTTQDPEVAYRWHKEGFLVIMKGTVALRKGNKKTTASDLNKWIRCMDKGYVWDGEDLYADDPIVVPSRNSLHISVVGSSIIRNTRNQEPKLDTPADVIKNLDEQGLIKLTARKRKVLSRVNRKKTDIRKIKRVSVPHDMNRLTEYAQSKGITGGMTTLYHGTRNPNVAGIISQGFSLNHSRETGMLGRGIYLGQQEKASHYSGGIILVVNVFLGNCRELDDLDQINAIHNKEYDSLHLKAGRYSRAYGGSVQYEEWVIRDPKLTEVVGLIIID